MINVKSQWFLEMVMLLRKQSVVVYCPYHRPLRFPPENVGLRYRFANLLARERKGKGSRWPNKFLWRSCDHVDRFGRMVLLASDHDLLHSYQ